MIALEREMMKMKVGMLVSASIVILLLIIYTDTRYFEPRLRRAVCTSSGCGFLSSVLLGYIWLKRERPNTSHEQFKVVSLTLIGMFGILLSLLFSVFFWFYKGHALSSPITAIMVGLIFITYFHYQRKV